MSGVDMQLDMSTLSLAGLGTFSNVLSVLSADDIQPSAMLQLEQLGSAFPISGPLMTRIPDQLQRCASTRLDRLGVMIGWRKGDAASLMAQSTGGQAISLLATCLENIYGNATAGSIFYHLSKTLLPSSVRLSSPKQLMQATNILANKLGVIGFGTHLAKHVYRIHEAYRHLQERAPTSLLASLSPDGMSEILSKFSQALRKERSIVCVRGCASMGYIFALAVTMFPDDCIVTVESLIIHQGSRSSSICIDITDHLGEKFLQTEVKGKIDSFSDIRVLPGKPSSSLKFVYPGYLAAYMQIHLQEMGVVCLHVAIEAMGACILSLSDLVHVTIGERAGDQPMVSVHLFSQVFGEFPRVALHQRCEEALGVTLPLRWPSFSKTFTTLQHVLARSNGVDQISQLADNISRYCDPSTLLLRIIDEGIASLAVHIHGGAVWQERSDPRVWSPSTKIQKQVAKIIIPPQGVLSQLFSWNDVDLVVKSDGTTTLVPAGISQMGSDLSGYRGLELFDGVIYHDNRYHTDIYTEIPYNNLSRSLNEQFRAPSSEIYPTMEGVHSDLSLTLSEQVRGLALECSVQVSGQRHLINLRECVDHLFGLFNANPCRHTKKTQLKQEYVGMIQTNSILEPDARQGDQISIVQTAGNPTAQFLSLTKWDPALLCHKSCLNCAYEQARDKEIYKIIVA
ncbi:hypothetical protein N7508_007729 [Penicillium antarcticum]|uniref:uncharacterized protein n=1 Tax=Penicillium antarcticum TaxID=416450 RepID=UPI0023A0D9D5|nr:uncharacterized protein N7508_007729 [Penicillium antarcticum]KAJ5297480.1 hypothetical protein N7508_007729 [Penicillium antarcticum]